MFVVNESIIPITSNHSLK